MKRAQEVEERERLMFERETIRRKEEAESQERELERLRLQLKIAEAKGASDLGTENAEIQAGARVSMRDLLQPYKMSEDVALFLVNIERTCVRMGRTASTRLRCGFCFVEYYTHADAENAMRYVNSTKLDDRIIRTDWDARFVEVASSYTPKAEAKCGTSTARTTTAAEVAMAS
nr:uncharacterized protein LOC119165505 [Rhipicephalus microplus]